MKQKKERIVLEYTKEIKEEIYKKANEKSMNARSYILHLLMKEWEKENKEV